MTMKLYTSLIYVLLSVIKVISRPQYPCSLDSNQYYLFITWNCPSRRYAIPITQSAMEGSHYYESSSITLADNQINVTLHDYSKSWNKARDICEGNGGSLWKEDSEERMMVTLEYLPLWPSHDIWIGFHYPLNETGDNFGWADCWGQDLGVFGVWKQGEPTKPQSERCAHLEKNTGEWKTKPCGSKIRFICQSLGGPCTFTTGNGVPVASLDYESLPVTAIDVEACKTQCLSQIHDYTNCWAINYDITSGCILYFTTNPFLFLTLGRSSVSTAFNVKECYTRSIDSTDDTTTTATDSDDPDTACSTFNTQTTPAPTTTTTKTFSSSALTTTSTSTSTTSTLTPSSTTTTPTTSTTTEPITTTTSTVTPPKTSSSTVDRVTITIGIAASTTSTTTSTDAPTSSTSSTFAPTTSPSTGTVAATNTTTSTVAPLPTTTTTDSTVAPTISPSTDTVAATTTTTNTVAPTIATTTMSSTSTAASNTTSSVCFCPCSTTPNSTAEIALDVKIELTRLKLQQDIKTLSSTIRKKTSAPDDRTSSKLVGFVAIIVCCLQVGFFVIPDVIRFLKYCVNKAFEGKASGQQGRGDIGP